MKYGIKIKGKLDNNGFYAENGLKSVLSEHTGPSNIRPLSFETQAEAELYAQSLELKNYTVQGIA
jgi:hypothetical protein